jgi:hypothetical protein
LTSLRAVFSVRVSKILGAHAFTTS